MSPYKPKWGLDFVGQPSFGVGVDPFGTYAAGGVSFLFSDMLGNHVIGTSVQVTSRFDEFGGSIFYMNRTHRWNWGASLEQTPYVSRGFEAGYVGNTYVEREYRYLQRDQSATAFLTYPFSRAWRVEFSGGSRRIGAELRTDAADLLRELWPAADRRDDAAPGVPDAQPHRGEHRPRLRHFDRRARPARFAAAATGWSSCRAEARSRIRACSRTCVPI